MNIFFVLASLFCAVLCEPAVKSDLELELEEYFIKAFRDFLKYEEEIVKKLTYFKNSIEKIHNKAANDKNYLKNLTNSFLIVKRIIMDWHFMIAIASLKPYELLEELYQNVSDVRRHPAFPSLANLTNSVLKIADAQEKHGLHAVSEFAAMVTNEPYAKLTASQCFVFAHVLKAVNKSTLAESWEIEGITQALSEDPLMEIQDFSLLRKKLHAFEK